MKYFIFFILVFYNNSCLSFSLFETSFHNVEFISDNIESDKLNAIKQLKKKTILIIFEKTLEKKQFENLSKSLSEDLINTFIKNIIINNEKIINNKYQSKIKINYEKKKIISFYREKKIPYVEYLPNQILLIISEEDNLNNNLFTENNKFYSYYINNYDNYNKLFKIPNLDINDRYILNKKDIDSKNKKKILNFSNKYELNNVITVIVKKNNKNTTYDLALFSGGEIIERRLDFNKYEFNKFFKILEKEAINLWKNINQIQNNHTNLLSCRVTYFNMLELKEIKNNLNSISLLKNINIKSLSYKKIHYEMYYYGNLKILSNLFQLNKLKINDINSDCTIKLK